MSKKPWTPTGRLALTLALGAALFLLWLLTSLAIRPPAAHAADLTVCPSGPCDYTSIQDAVDAAIAGDVIKVAAGVYTGVNSYGGMSQVVYISKAVTIRGGYTTTNWAVSDPVANPTTLDAQGMGRVMVITGTIAPTVEGLHITGGDAYLLEGGQYGCDAGGGVYVHSATATISNCMVYSNTASSGSIGAGGGIFLYGSPSTLTDNTVTSNTASSVLDGSGGGVALYLGAATLEDNTIQNNIASINGSGWGGGVYLLDSAAELVSNTIQGNFASTANWGLGTGGGIYLSSYRPVTLTGNTVISNPASTVYWGDGGGLSIEYAEATLIGNTVTGNTASAAYDGSGGGISISTMEGYGPPVTLEQNTVRNNVASVTDNGRGGGLYIEGNTTMLTSNTVVSNTATLSPTATGEGGGVWIGDFWDGTFTMTNNLMAGNHATTAGSGLYVTGVQMGTTGRLLHNTIANNHGSGQGVYVGQFTTLFFSNTTIAGHASVGITATSDSHVTLAGTLWHDNGLDVGGAGAVFSSTNVYGDPAFADPASWDYHLTASSAAIDAGMDAGVATDFEGDTRPQGDGFDIGYDESPFTIQADVAVVKSVTPAIVAPNQVVTYTLTFTNTGPHPALDVLITDAVPITLTNVSYINAGAAITPTGSFS
jgi:fibronectin-binding autotransporter adhesin